jgi:hypothetical protein
MPGIMGLITVIISIEPLDGKKIMGKMNFMDYDADNYLFTGVL